MALVSLSRSPSSGGGGDGASALEGGNGGGSGGGGTGGLAIASNRAGSLGGLVITTVSGAVPGDPFDQNSTSPAIAPVRHPSARGVRKPPLWPAGWDETSADHSPRRCDSTRPGPVGETASFADGREAVFREPSYFRTWSPLISRPTVLRASTTRSRRVLRRSAVARSAAPRTRWPLSKTSYSYDTCQSCRVFFPFVARERAVGGEELANLPEA